VQEILKNRLTAEECATQTEFGAYSLSINSGYGQ